MRKKILWIVFTILAINSQDIFVILAMMLALLGFKYKIARIMVIPYGLFFMILNLDVFNIIMWALYILFFSRR